MELQMKRDTLYAAINFVDRYLSLTTNIGKSKLQLIGVVSLFIAAKIEEIYPPLITDFAKSADDGYSLTEIVELELEMIKVCACTPHSFSNERLSRPSVHPPARPALLVEVKPGNA